MERNGDKWSSAWRYAWSFLGGYRDHRTTALREDLAQGAILHALRWPACPPDGARLREAMRTITRRHRRRALTQAARGDLVVFVAFGEDVAEPAAPQAGEALLSIAGRAVPLTWARARLGQAMGGMPRLDRQLLLGFHEGFCCAELAQRFDRTPTCVKSRLHRARRRLRTAFEGLVRGADGFEVLEKSQEEA